MCTRLSRTSGKTSAAELEQLDQNVLSTTSSRSRNKMGQFIAEKNIELFIAGEFIPKRFIPNYQ
jgi:hypothetical protein